MSDDPQITDWEIERRKNARLRRRIKRLEEQTIRQRIRITELERNLHEIARILTMIGEIS